jgi:hypothetical protein
MKNRLFAFVLAAAVAVGGCGFLGIGGGAAAPPGLPADASAAQVTADEVVQALDKGWNATSVVCLQAEKSGLLPVGSCAKALLPAEMALQAAAAGVDAFNSGASKDFPCLVSNAIVAFKDVENLLKTAKISLPSEVDQAISVIQAFVPGCAASDGGAG